MYITSRLKNRNVYVHSMNIIMTVYIHIIYIPHIKKIVWIKTSWGFWFPFSPKNLKIFLYSVFVPYIYIISSVVWGKTPYYIIIYIRYVWYSGTTYRVVSFVCLLENRNISLLNETYCNFLAIYIYEYVTIKNICE